MAMALACTRGSRTVEKPQAIGVASDGCDRLPIQFRQPSLLGLPALADHQDMAWLDRIFVE
jgi:hypothetical protein